MSKRKIAQVLTGGTGDVNPQWVAFGVVQSGNDIATTGSLALPISPSMVSRDDHALVIELLKVQFIWALDATQAPALPQQWLAILTTADVPSGVPESTLLTSTQTVVCHKTAAFQFGAGATIAVIDRAPVIDVTDGAGHGLVIAARNIFLTVLTTGTAISNRVTARMLYRYKEVRLTEYLTLAQFQT